MHGRVNSYHTSEIREERNFVIKKEQANLAQLALVFKVMINTIVSFNFQFKIEIKIEKHCKLWFTLNFDKHCNFNTET